MTIDRKSFRRGLRLLLSLVFIANIFPSFFQISTAECYVDLDRCPCSQSWIWYLPGGGHTLAKTDLERHNSLHSFPGECKISKHLHSTTNCREQPRSQQNRGPHRDDESVDAACNLQGPHRTAETEEIPTEIEGGDTRRENKDDSERKARRYSTTKNKHEGDKVRSVRYNWRKSEESPWSRKAAEEGRRKICSGGHTLNPWSKKATEESRRKICSGDITSSRAAEERCRDLHRHHLRTTPPKYTHQINNRSRIEKRASCEGICGKKKRPTSIAAGT